MSKKNPIEQQLAMLDEQWEEYISSEQPIFRWALKPDAINLANTFVKIKEQFNEDSSDLFVGLSTNFIKAESYGFELAQELNSLLEEGFKDAIEQEQAEKQSVQTNNLVWAPVDLTPYNNGFQALLACAEKVIEAFDNHIDLLVLPIMPAQASDIGQYVYWWQNCALVHRDYTIWPERLKFIVFENTASPLLGEPAADFPTQFFNLQAPSDMKGAVNQLLEEADDGSPGAALRKEIVALNYAVGEQDKAVMEVKADRALTIAKKNNFLDMQATVHMIRAAGYLNMGLCEQAINDYRLAQTIAAQGQQQNVLGCDKIVLQSTTLEGTALFNQKNYAQAATVYQRAAELAEIQKDNIMAMEGWRMSAFSFEQNKQKDFAWEKGIKAMEVGQQMKQQERQQSTLAFVGDALIRVAPNADTRRQVHAKFDELLGTGWLNQLRDDTA